MKKYLSITACVLALLLCCSCKAGVKRYRIEVVREYPHDAQAYTQGLFFHDGRLYESTGQYGESSFRELDLRSGDVVRRLDFNRNTSRKARS